MQVKTGCFAKFRNSRSQQKRAGFLGFQQRYGALSVKRHLGSACFVFGDSDAAVPRGCSQTVRWRKAANIAIPQPANHSGDGCPQVFPRSDFPLRHVRTVHRRCRCQTSRCRKTDRRLKSEPDTGRRVRYTSSRPSAGWRGGQMGLWFRRVAR